VNGWKRRETPIQTGKARAWIKTSKFPENSINFIAFSRIVHEHKNIQTQRKSSCEYPLERSHHQDSKYELDFA
jgi:hypothetical protein